VIHVIIRNVLVIVFVASAPLQAGESLKVLFIGNSLTYTNDLPKMIADLAKAGGQGIFQYETEVPGGCTLEKHWKDGKALAKIKSKAWDYVVLQDNSTQPLKDPKALATYGKMFADVIAEQKSKTAIYMTWAWTGQFDTQPTITKAYQDLATSTGSVLIPAGVAFDACRRAHPDRSMVTDTRHPDLAGTYLIACVFYSVWYHVSPVGLPGTPAKLDAERARELQEAAWVSVQVKP
jgi:hypothetical protein